jgi:hypothetical protein
VVVRGNATTNIELPFATLFVKLMRPAWTMEGVCAGTTGGAERVNALVPIRDEVPVVVNADDTLPEAAKASYSSEILFVNEPEGCVKPDPTPEMVFPETGAWHIPTSN